MKAKSKVVIFGCLTPRDYPLEAQHLLDDPSWEIWCMNASMAPERWDRWFQLHSYQHMVEVHGYEYIRKIRAMAMYYRQPLYVFDKWVDSFPGAEIFPHRELVESYGDYFTGSYAWLLSYARYLDFKEVFINAGSMEGEEWAMPCIEYHAGQCIQEGMEVRADQASGLFDQRGGLYGYDPLPHLGGYDEPLDTMVRTANTIRGVRRV